MIKNVSFFFFFGKSAWKWARCGGGGLPWALFLLLTCRSDPRPHRCAKRAPNSPFSPAEGWRWWGWGEVGWGPPRRMGAAPGGAGAAAGRAGRWGRQNGGAEVTWGRAAGPPLPGSEEINPSRGVKNGLYIYFFKWDEGFFGECLWGLSWMGPQGAARNAAPRPAAIPHIAMPLKNLSRVGGQHNPKEGSEWKYPSANWFDGIRDPAHCLRTVLRGKKKGFNTLTRFCDNMFIDISNVGK